MLRGKRELSQKEIETTSSSPMRHLAFLSHKIYIFISSTFFFNFSNFFLTLINVYVTLSTELLVSLDKDHHDKILLVQVLDSIYHKITNLLQTNSDTEVLVTLSDTCSLQVVGTHRSLFCFTITTLSIIVLTFRHIFHNHEIHEKMEKQKD